MLKFISFLKQYSKFYGVAIVLGVVMGGCGGGVGSDKYLCGGDPCPSIRAPNKPITHSSIKFISAIPALLSIKSAGGDERSLITFKVADSSGVPFGDVSVSFALSDTKGGVTLSGTSTMTDSKGEASVIVNAGSENTTVTVTATVDATQEFATSSALNISTGVADYDNFSLSLDLSNPHAFNRDGEVVTVTAKMQDMFKIAPPDGVVISFYAEGGKIEKECRLVAGTCSVKWSGQNPRPTVGGGERAGRVAILAYSYGAESFNDLNKNGIFDDDDKFLIEQDLPEPWADHDESGKYDIGEYFVDSNKNGVRDQPDGKYSGPLCTHSTLCSPVKKVVISRQSIIVMASDTVELSSADISTDLLDNGKLDIGKGKTYKVTARDSNGNSLPGGSSVSITTTNGILRSESKIDIMRNTLEPKKFTIELEQDDEPSATGELTIAVNIKNSAGITTRNYTMPISDLPQVGGDDFVYRSLLNTSR